MALVMVIDDEPGIRELIRRVLEKEGHVVTEAPDGKSALRHFAGQPADLVISDVYMPEMDGIEFLMRLREGFPETRIIMVSGGGVIPKERVLEASSALGAVETLQKPLELKDLRDAVSRALGTTE